MNKKGFTLIELLVVVLIIGILAAIAVPQYQKAVMKSRYATLKDLVKSISAAQDVYFLSHGKYAKKFADLDITMPSNIINNDTNDPDHVSDQYNYDWGYCVIRRNAKEQTQCFCANNYNMVYFVGKEEKKYRCLVFGSTEATDYPLQNNLCKNETGSDVKGSGSLGPNLYVRYDY